MKEHQQAKTNNRENLKREKEKEKERERGREINNKRAQQTTNRVIKRHD